MRLIGNGLESGSSMYFYTPSQMAKNLLFYPLAVGDFYCNNSYCVERERYDSILATLVLDGSLSIIQGENIITANKNEMLLINCYKPHKYFSTSDAHTLWMHFDGVNSLEIYEDIVSKKGQKIKCTSESSNCIYDIISLVKNDASEYDLSSSIYSFLCQISKIETNNYSSEKSKRIQKAKEYITNNYYKNITVEKIAKAVNMSESYFSKIFKDATSISPYNFLLNVRLEKSKELLLKTDLPISEIAYKTGFNSDANFIYFFKNSTNISPLKFRKMKF